MYKIYNIWPKFVPKTDHMICTQVLHLSFVHKFCIIVCTVVLHIYLHVFEYKIVAIYCFKFCSILI